MPCGAYERDNLRSAWPGNLAMGRVTEVLLKCYQPPQHPYDGRE